MTAFTVGNYETRNFEFYPEAQSAFADSIEDGADMRDLEKVAKHVDAAFGILKKAAMVGVLHQSEYDEFASRIDDAEVILDEIDELHNHYYLRDTIDMMAIEMLDLSDVDVDDGAENYSDLDELLFGEPENDEESDSDDED